ncbi:hypothetical protein Msil_1928 [Methylocella silvestris BL2]|uniref:Uncharacterized protein n=1 Tax=Methylocella silvestris (strain DSM 15510 / CIP 108128 / LMG 27833 / NCIMB 13906 / BL2) TaxID=395965 RepID=B8ENT7_METSB|nr:hypothetical protein Msil_1928 [Methylocella silvestris BL2]
MSTRDVWSQYPPLPTQQPWPRFLLKMLVQICAIVVAGFLLYVTVQAQAKLITADHTEDLPFD